ncbi:acetyl-CoA carboxylase biotin carboxylase subunit [Anaeromyxobacter paludicola]|uniref:3-methylcrotonyl-CoA carboxylase subunit alpha n=1 Tax=Anaeromyxobacter paludicola TaxID=2918171 RepID=A0ABN6NAN5_9BACT|nr:acetyl-CoA carboxylase biotin carboxylase subunit [Anaeromyxobacter paludicola]BDG09481.1 3-methylcrotonyl-CoA carboxylase subunit alpha [Anaeromyxobacter paludicola]
MSSRREITKILVANRGEIAVRVMRTCREMGIPTVAVYSDADRGCLHVRYADEAVHLGPSPARESYLAIDKVIAAARQTGADAVHPGYGFLSENPAFARAAAQAGLAFIGPPPESMEAMGVKTTARARMAAAGVPTVPGSPAPLAGPDEARAFAESIGFPVMIKAAAGGGGKGMKRCERAEDLPALWASARREAAGAFGDDRLYLEKYLDRPRHVEIQVFFDGHGNGVWLGERECSVQRRHQKVIEETPSCALDGALREAMGEVAVRAARAVGYVGAGTVEFLVDARRSFYFLEMNTRLQVEHPVTELCTGLDLVRLQIEVARGARLPFTQAEVARRGHAIEARVYAEDPAKGFFPSPGRISYLRAPGGPGVRDDAGVYTGWVVSPYYDPLLSKLSAWAPTREEAIARLDRALGEYVVHGIATNLTWLRQVLRHPAFRAGDYDTGFCQAFAADLAPRPDPRHERAALAAAAVAAFKRDLDREGAFAARALPAGGSGWVRAGRARALKGGPR